MDCFCSLDNKGRICVREGKAARTHYDIECSLVAAGSRRQQKNKHKYETLMVTTEDNITKIMFNRPQRKNAIDFVMSTELLQALEEAAKDDSTITVLTGSGDYFCSGNDLNNLMAMSAEKVAEMTENGGENLRKFVSLFIDFPKPLIALVNGPAIGIGVTLLGLCDVVYATKKATFLMPFTLLGQSPEGCSTATFPAMMGPAKAAEMLLFNRKLTASEACDRGLVAEVFADSTFQSEVWKRLSAYAVFPKESLALTKQLIRGVLKEKLHKANSLECECLVQRISSAESMNAIQSFLKRRSKL